MNEKILIVIKKIKNIDNDSDKYIWIDNRDEDYRHCAITEKEILDDVKEYIIEEEIESDLDINDIDISVYKKIYQITSK